jgi:hypothetical protein
MSDKRLRIPAYLHRDAQEIFNLTDSFCAEHLDAEYAGLCPKLVARLARKRPSPLARGDLRIWAGAVIYTVGSINFLFDRSQRLHLTGDQVASLIGVPKSTLANTAKQIRGLLRLGHFDRELCRRELLEKSPLAWMIMVNGFVVDARMMPPEIQAIARRKGLIPNLPATEPGDAQGTSGA